MENYVLETYHRELKQHPELGCGFDRFEAKIKRIVYFLIAGMFGACIGLFVSFLRSSEWGVYISAAVCLCASFGLIYIDNRDRKEHMDKHIGLRKQKLGILKSILEQDYNLNSRTKIEELLNLYSAGLQKQIEEEKRHNGIILGIYSATVGVIAFSFQNAGSFGMDISSWLVFASILCIFAGLGCIWVYSFRIFNTMKRKLERMIKDIQDLLLLNY